MQGVLIGLWKIQVIQNEVTFFAQKIMAKKENFLTCPDKPTRLTTLSELLIPHF